MIPPRPPQDGARPQLTDELRRARSDEREPDADLVPVEDGEPMPAEERRPDPRSERF